MSPRAAWRLESIGFTRVYDYVAGKADWGSYGLPIDGQRPSDTRVGAHVRGDVPACAPAERLRDVCDRIQATNWHTCFVVNEQRVVLGRIGRSALSRADDTTVETAMSSGPSTVRPGLELDKAVERMRAQKLTGLPVTRSDGILFGLLRRNDAERALTSDEPDR